MDDDDRQLLFLYDRGKKKLLEGNQVSFKGECIPPPLPLITSCIILVRVYVLIIGSAPMDQCLSKNLDLTHLWKLLNTQADVDCS